MSCGLGAVISKVDFLLWVSGTENLLLFVPMSSLFFCEVNFHLMKRLIYEFSNSTCDVCEGPKDEVLITQLSLES